MPHAPSDTRSILKQPKQVWAVGFACVVAFMGIGLVDPILPAIAEGMRATPTETELLFTSYLLVTGLAMLVTSWIASRIGAKRTLLIGLALIVVFALLAGLGSNVESIIAFRAGWGLGNALFISTALATIVGAASGGASSAIILYEAALGLGIASARCSADCSAPSTGADRSSAPRRSWRSHSSRFSCCSTRTDTEPRVPTKLSAPLRALRNPVILVLATAALFYNIGFFILLAYSPFPLGMTAIGLGLVFFGWGVAVAITSVWVAPLFTARMRRTTVLAVVLPLLALDLVAAGIFVSSQLGLVLAVIVGGLLLGVLNTVFTESVMEGTDLPRSVASSSYSAVRFLGGAAAPPLATLLAEFFVPATPYFVGAASVLVAMVIVIVGAGKLGAVNHRPVPELAVPALIEAEAIGIGDA